MEIRNCKTLMYESMNYTGILYAYEGDKEHYCKYTAWLELILPRQGLAAAD